MRRRSAARLVALAAGGLAVSLIVAMLVTALALLLLGAFVGFGNAFLVFFRLFVASGVLWVVAAATAVAGVASLVSHRAAGDLG